MKSLPYRTRKPGVKRLDSFGTIASELDPITKASELLAREIDSTQRIYSVKAEGRVKTNPQHCCFEWIWRS